MSTSMRASSRRRRAPELPEGAGRRSTRRPRDRVASLVLHAVLVVGLVAMVGPFVWTLLSSVKPEGEIRLVPTTWWPHHPTLDNYRDLFARLNFPTYFLNSAIVASLITL